MEELKSRVEILKAKLRDDLFITVTYSENVAGEVSNVTKECNTAVHDDLRKAFRQLTPHLALIAEQVHCNDEDGRYAGDYYTLDEEDKEQVKNQNSTELLMDPDQFFSFTHMDWAIVREMMCTGFTISGSGDTEGVTLIGRRELRNGKVLTLTAPFIKLVENRGYNFHTELAEVLETCKSEIYAYLFEGKRRPEKQLNLFDDLDTQEQAGKLETVNKNDGGDGPFYPTTEGEIVQPINEDDEDNEHIEKPKTTRGKKNQAA